LQKLLQALLSLETSGLAQLLFLRGPELHVQLPFTQS
jgi:hypothetical protein